LPDTNNPLHYYSQETIKTNDNGALEIAVDLTVGNFTNAVTGQTETKEVRSGMLSSWNKVCFTGGIVEVSVKLPGDHRSAGLWPAFWMMGNLARATYVESTEGTWPFSTNVCSYQTNTSQKLNACNATDFFNPSQPGRGRGAPEIDILEVMQMDIWSTPTYEAPPVLSASLQVAPGKNYDRPIPGKDHHKINWYQPEVGNTSSFNEYYYGVYILHDDHMLDYQSDTVSFNHNLNHSFYERQVTYRVEWEPPSDDGTGGYVRYDRHHDVCAQC
jgi:beta-glucan synthesis-associated protein KRE6